MGVQQILLIQATRSPNREREISFVNVKRALWATSRPFEPRQDKAPSTSAQRPRLAPDRSVPPAPLRARAGNL